MKLNFSRPLYNKDLIEKFLTGALGFTDKKFNEIVDAIYNGELGITQLTDKSQTLNSTELRDRSCVDESSRWQLRARIIEKLLTKVRLDDDERIRLGSGGALPKSNVQKEKKAVIIIGLPASGKSGIASTIADDFGAVIIDSDYAKRKLPEYKKHAHGASIVHDESTRITTGFKENPMQLLSLYERCIEDGYNIVIPRIGYSAKSISSLANSLKELNGYEIHLILVHLMKREATIRAIYRFNKTKRYVPLGLIFDEYGNDPCMSYYFLKNHNNGLFTSFGAVYTLNEPICIDVEGNSPIAGKFDCQEFNY